MGLLNQNIGINKISDVSDILDLVIVDLDINAGENFAAAVFTYLDLNGRNSKLLAKVRISFTS
ncbi:MAG: hypothetical protein LRY40_06400 [Shewanella fodinae]|nr:hypothetical protein [Shewanella fodinae]